MKLSELIKERQKYADPFLVRAEDKISGIQLAKDAGVPTPEIFFTGDSIDSFSSDTPFVVKHNNLSTSVGVKCFPKGGTVCNFNKRSTLRGVPSVVQNIVPRVMIEEMVFPHTSDKVLYDIKFLFLKNKLWSILVVDPKERKVKYTMDENLQPVKFFNDNWNFGTLTKLPHHIHDCIKYAKILSEKYFHDTFIRIDFYSTSRGAVFGEFTTNPWGGNGICSDQDIAAGKYFLSN